MSDKPTYEELERLVKTLKSQVLGVKRDQSMFEDSPNIHMLLDSAPYGIFIIDLAGKIIFASEKAAERLGKTPKEIIGTTLTEYFPPDIAEKRRLKGFEAVNSGTPQKLEDQVGDRWYYSKICPLKDSSGIITSLAIYSDDITERKQVEKEREELLSDLQASLRKVKTLKGLVPICSHCKSIRNDKGYWSRIESYISLSTDADLSHGICPDCAKKYYPDINLYND